MTHNLDLGNRSSALNGEIYDSPFEELLWVAVAALLLLVGVFAAGSTWCGLFFPQAFGTEGMPFHPLAGIAVFAIALAAFFAVLGRLQFLLGRSIDTRFVLEETTAGGKKLRAEALYKVWEQRFYVAGDHLTWFSFNRNQSSSSDNINGRFLGVINSLSDLEQKFGKWERLRGETAAARRQAIAMRATELELAEWDPVYDLGNVEGSSRLTSSPAPGSKESYLKVYGEAALAQAKVERGELKQRFGDNWQNTYSNTQTQINEELRELPGVVGQLYWKRYGLLIFAGYVLTFGGIALPFVGMWLHNR